MTKVKRISIMSYRDLRNFSEAMRVLGFPEPISVESFRRPNWVLLEACLRWLAARLEPGAALAGGRASTDQRVAMVTHAVQLFHSRANLKLNGKRVYGADGWAVRELLKVGGLLRAALHAPAPDQRDLVGDAPVYDVSSRIGEIKEARSLATDITAKGAFLYDLLAKEPENKELRDAALSRPLELAGAEAGLARAAAALAARAEEVRGRVEGARAGAAALDAKIERRRAELQRAEKRLHTVQKIKPSYQGELTALETEIEGLWDQYVLRYRCVEALKHQLSLLEASQAEAAEEQQAAIMQLIHKYEAEDVLGKLSDSDEMESSDESKAPVRPRPATRPKTRPNTRLRIKTAAAENRAAFGSMQARESLDEPDDRALDSDDSDHLYGGDGSVSRWSRPRPATRTLAGVADYADLVDDVDSSEEMSDGAGAGAGVGAGAVVVEGSLGSSSESELRLGSAPGRASVLSDNEF